MGRVRAFPKESVNKGFCQAGFHCPGARHGVADNSSLWGAETRGTGFEVAQQTVKGVAGQLYSEPLSQETKTNKKN